MAMAAKNAYRNCLFFRATCLQLVFTSNWSNFRHAFASRGFVSDSWAFLCTLLADRTNGRACATVLPNILDKKTCVILVYLALLYYTVCGWTVRPREQKLLAVLTVSIYRRFLCLSVGTEVLRHTSGFLNYATHVTYTQRKILHMILRKQRKVWPITWRGFTDRIVAVAGPTLLNNTIKLGRTGSCDEMIRGRVRTLNKLNSPLSSRVSLVRNVCFVFGGDAFFAEEQTKQQLCYSHSDYICLLGLLARALQALSDRYCQSTCFWC